MPNVASLPLALHPVSAAQQIRIPDLDNDQCFYKQAQALAHVGTWSSGVASRDALELSTECCQIFGIEPGTEMRLGTLFSLVHPEDRDRIERARRAAIDRGDSYSLEHRIVRPDGEVRWLLQRASVLRDRQGRALRLVGIVQDVTDSRQVFEKLRASERRYRRIVETTSEGVWLIDAGARTTFMNGPMAAMLGYTTQEAMGRRLSSFMSEAGHALALKNVEAQRRGGPTEQDFKFRRKDGSDLLASLRIDPLFDADGGYEGALALVTDVTERRAQEQSRALLAAIVESTDDAVYSTSTDGTISSWNRAAASMFGYSGAEVLGRPVAMLAPADETADAAPEVVPSAEVGRLEHVLAVRRRKDGSLMDVVMTVSPLRDVAGLVVGVSTIARDLSAQRRAEAEHRSIEDQLRQAQKMEAVGCLAGGVAHDFNNLLSVIISYSDMALSELATDHPIREHLEEIRSAGNRAAELTHQLLAFSRRQALQPRVLDPDKEISGMEKMIHRLMGEDVELTLLLAASPRTMLADAGQLSQVLMNLAVNARDAMPEGGKLTIETAAVDLDEASAAAHPGVTPGPYVMIAVTDSGVGMDQATQARIFEPFFTTKAERGTGLGLATAFRVVKQSGGDIQVYSEPGRGTTFRIYLPGSALRNGSEAPSGEELDLQRGTETVLLVEDEDQVRHVARDILRRSGYTVVEAENAGEALLVCEQHQGPIHLLLTDVVMPKMTGRQLADRLQPLRPEMRVLYMSGYTGGAIVQLDILPPGIAYLQKPLTPTTLLRKIRDLLDL